MTQAPALLDEEHAAFIQAGVSLNAASCDHHNRPASCRLLGCRVLEGGHRIAVFLSARQGEYLLECLRATSAIAVVFSQPSTHRTVQVKGWDAQVRALAEGELQIIRAYRESFADELEPIGFSRIMVRTLLAAAPADLVAVEFSPCDAFSQTPGPPAPRLGAKA
jgi:hypothetical protein